MPPQIEIAAGVALILFGVRFLRKGLIRMLGSQLDLWLSKLSSTRQGAALAGLIFGTFAPSSTTQSVLAVNMVRTNKLPVENLLPFLLCANLGITVMVQLLSWNLTQIYPLLLVLGILLFQFSKGAKTRGIGQVFFSFGLVFLAMKTIGGASKALLADSDSAEILVALSGHSILLVLGSAIAGVLCQSSMAVMGVGFAIANASVGVDPNAINPTFSHMDILAVVLGATLGIGVTTLIAGWSDPQSRSLALANLSLKLLVIVPLTYFLPQASAILSTFPGTIAIQAGLFHAFTNFYIAVIGTLLSPFITPIFSKIAKKEEMRSNEPSLLDYSLLNKPALALGCASREILRMGGDVQLMYAEVWRAYKEKSSNLAQMVIKKDQSVDTMEEEINSYLGRIDWENLSPKDRNLAFGLINFSTQLESVADVISNQLAKFVVKNQSKPIRIDSKKQEDLERLYILVKERIDRALAVLASKDKEVARDFLIQGNHLKKEFIQILRGQYQQMGEGHDHFSTSVFISVCLSLRRMSGLLNTIGHTFSQSHLEGADGESD